MDDVLFDMTEVLLDNGGTWTEHERRYPQSDLFHELLHDDGIRKFKEDLL